MSSYLWIVWFVLQFHMSFGHNLVAHLSSSATNIQPSRPRNDSLVTQKVEHSIVVYYYFFLLFFRIYGLIKAERAFVFFVCVAPLEGSLVVAWIAFQCCTNWYWKLAPRFSHVLRKCWIKCTYFHFTCLEPLSSLSKLLHKQMLSTLAPKPKLTWILYKWTAAKVLS